MTRTSRFSSAIRSLIRCSLIVFCTAFFSIKATAQAELFNAGWKFHKGDLNGGKTETETEKVSDAKWRKVDLPHDWSIEGPFSDEWASGTGYLPGGVAWYRKTFVLPAGMKGKQVSIYFDGVYKNSEVWINGHLLGKRPNGYIPFYYDLTPHLKQAGSNLISVRVDHTDFADSRWYPGSGIYRNVYLTAKNPVHLDTWGVAFTTPEISAQRATAKVNVSIKNASATTSPVEVKATLIDASGKIRASGKTTVTVTSAQSAASSIAMAVPQPELWSTERPYLYKLVVATFIKGQKTDEYSSSVGFRTVRFDPNEGFFLNGKNMKIKGVCVHHDAGALGAAVPQEVWARRLQLLKDAGCNAIRMSHYPHQDYLYKLCDKMGLMVMDEAFDEWRHGKNKWIAGWNKGKPGKDGYHTYFDEWAERDVKDMVLSHRNHTSIILWSIGNEIDYPNDPYSHPILDSGRNAQIYRKGYLKDNPKAKELGDIAKTLVAVVKAHDDSRPVTAALAGVSMSNQTAYPGLLDVVGYNYQEYRYEEDHEKYPNRIIYGSENGKSLDAWLAVDTNKYISGQFLWTGFDFMGEAKTWPVRSSQAGLLDLAGFPKMAYYFRQSLWSEKPMVYLQTFSKSPDGKNTSAVPAWNWNSGDKVGIQCISNAEEAELFLNGRSLGRKSVKKDGKNQVNWTDQNFEAGVLEARAYAGNKEVARNSLRTAGPAQTIAATADRTTLGTAKKELAHIEISLTDKNGIPVYLADNEITVQVEGPGKLLGLESGDVASHEDYRSNKRKAHHGKLLAYIQSQQQAGIIKVTLNAPGLTAKTIQIQVK